MYEIVSQDSLHCLPRLELLATTAMHTIIHSSMLMLVPVA